MYEYRAKLVKVIDGDTLDVALDLGFHIEHQVRLRLKGINCPEMHTSEGKSAKQFATDWLVARVFTVQTVKDATEKYGRYLARVISGDGDLNTALVAAGHAQHKDY